MTVRSRSRPSSGIVRARVALSALLSIVFFILLTSHPDDLVRSSAIWLLYVVVAGGVIEVGPDETLKRVVLLASVPTLIFFVTASFLTWLALFVETISICVTCGNSPMNYSQFGHQMLVYLAVTPPTLIGIVLGSYARTSLLNIYSKSRRVKLAELRSVQKKVTVVLSIVGLVGGWLLAAK
jgi:hypothetical protein